MIVVGPELKLHQCGLPKKIALELFQPFIIRRLKELGHADTIKSAKKMLERKDEEVWDILEEVIQEPPGAARTAPRRCTAWASRRSSRCWSKATPSSIHPLVCKGFNADFDGDQMAVHLPLSIEAQVEAHDADDVDQQHLQPGQRQPDHQPVAGHRDGLLLPDDERARARKGDGHDLLARSNEVDLAYAAGQGRHRTRRSRSGCRKHQRLQERRGRRSTSPAAIIETTVGRVIFNDILPQGHAVLQPRAAVERAGHASSPTATSSSAAARRSSCSTT